jgi:WD40 repeat protein
VSDRAGPDQFRKGVAQSVLAPLRRPLRVNPTKGWTRSPDGTRLVTTGDDGAIALWDAKTGKQIGTPVVIERLDIGGATYSPDGRWMGVADATGQVWLFPATAQGWTTYACQLANRNMTRAEWAQYIPGRTYEQLCPGR